MEKIINILIVLFLLLITYYAYHRTQKSNQDDTNNKNKIKMPVLRKENDILREDIYNSQKLGSILADYQQPDSVMDRTNNYHPDYNELFTYTQNMTRTDEFNAGNMPADHVSLEKNKVYSMAKDVLYFLSKKVNSGYKLCDVTNAHLYKTKDQQRYVFDMVLQKETPTSSNSKMILNIITLQDTRVYEDNFFKPNLKLCEGKVFGENDVASLTIESVLIVGYIRDDNPFLNEVEGPTNEDKYFEFQRDFEDHNEITDPEAIRQSVIRKKRQLNNEMRYVTMDNLDKKTSYYDPDFYELPVGIYKKDGEEEGMQINTKMGTTIYD